MHSCPVNFLLLLKDVIAHSGRGFFRKGHYQDCLQHPQMKYSVIEFGSGGVDAQAFVGLCLPRQCSDGVITKSINSAFKIMGLPLNVFSIDSNTENYDFPMNWLSYLTAFILVAIGVLVFAATVRGCDRKEKEGSEIKSEIKLERGEKRVKESDNKWVACFDLSTNIRQHFKIRENEDLNVWDGIRSISMMWVIIGHCYTFSLGGVINIANYQVQATKPFFLIIQAGLLSVDIFFMLGGFFLAFIMLRNKITAKICGLGILQRALRIWPSYILAMMFYYSLFMRLGSGMMWSKNQEGVQACSTMWREILFMSNLIENGQRLCLGWGWYLQVDFQLFIIGVFTLFLYSIRKSIFLGVTAIMSILSLIFNFVFTYKEKIRIFTDLDAFVNFEDFMVNLYIKPYGRCVPYLMGLVLGVLYMEYRKEKKDSPEAKETLLSRVRHYFENHNKIRVFFEWLGFGLMTLVAFIPRPLQLGAKWPQAVHSIYYTTSKPIFLFGLILTVLPSCLGIRHSFFNLILNAKVFVFIARISFCTYLVHLMVIDQYIQSRTYDIYYSLLDQLMVYLGQLPIILALGFVMTVTIEIPFGHLLKIFMGKLKEGRKRSKIIEKSQSLLTSQSINQDLLDKGGKTMMSSEATATS